MRKVLALTHIFIAGSVAVTITAVACVAYAQDNAQRIQTPTDQLKALGVASAPAISCLRR